MARWLYNIALSIYRALVVLLSLFHSKAQKMVKGRDQWAGKLHKSLEGVQQPLAWFHCASLGEFEQGRPLIEEFTRRFPEHAILLTFYSPSGFETRRNFPLAASVQYLPWDTHKNSQRFLDIAQPEVVFFIKYEYWYHILAAASARNIPVYLCSALFRPTQVFFRSYGGFYRGILGCFEHIFVQDEPSRKLLSDWAITQVTVSGDTRFDRVKSISEQASDHLKVAQFRDSSASPVMIVGSSWPEDMQVLIPVINNHPEVRFIIAPHEINQKHLESLSTSIERKVAHYSSVSDPTAFEVMVIDTVGILSHLYQYGDYAYIGGAFGKGLHNILEAATFGLPIFFGDKNFEKFREARDLVNLGGAYPVDSSKTLDGLLNQMLNQSDIKQQAGDICRQYVLENTGATDVIMQHVQKRISHL